MEILKKYWKEGVIVILLIFVGTILFKQSPKELTQEEIKEIETRNTIENLLNAQNEYNKLLSVKREKLEKEEQELKILEEAIAVKVEEEKKQVVQLKSKRDVLKQQYKVGSAYDTTKLDKLLRQFSNKKVN